MFMDLVDLRAVWPERAEQDWGGEEPAGNSHEYTVIGGQGEKYLYGGWDHYIVDVSAFNRSVHGSHLSYVIRNQRKAVEGFRCLSSIELSLYGTRELALARLSISDQTQSDPLKVLRDKQVARRLISQQNKNIWAETPQPPVLSPPQHHLSLLHSHSLNFTCFYCYNKNFSFVILDFPLFCNFPSQQLKLELMIHLV